MVTAALIVSYLPLAYLAGRLIANPITRQRVRPAYDAEVSDDTLIPEQPITRPRHFCTPAVY